MNQKYLGYQCSLCGEQYQPEMEIYVCPKDGGNLDILYDFAKLKRDVSVDSILSSGEASMWRYLPLLPVRTAPDFATPIKSVGWTPLYSPSTLKQKLGLSDLWIKDESRNPTASFKDRASALVVARAKEIGADVIVTASTGNAGAALAGMAAAADHQAVIFAPRSAPPAKIAQLLVYQARVLLVDGSYDQAFDLSILAADAFGWYCRNTGYNPFTLEGKKTAALEIWEQLLRANDNNEPLAIFVSVGDGNIISGLHKGFKDLKALGWLGQMPRIFGVQSDGSAAVANTFMAGDEVIHPVSANTRADSISVDLPRDGVRAVRAARETGGAYVTVPDEEIMAAIPVMGQAGIFAEPAGAAAFAGLQKALEKGMIKGGDPVLVLNTGSGLKDVQAALTAVEPAPIIEATLSAVERALDKR
ncbi:MAG: threonine synthase [Anaerolineales bacterium]